jgi:hypothetical protein
MLLKYQIGLGGLNSALRGLRSFEQRVKAINRAGAGGILAGAGMAGGRGAGAAGARAAAGQRTLNARMAAEEQRHQNRLRQIRERGNQARLRDAARAARAEARIRQREEARAARTSGGALRGGFAGRTGQSIRSGLRTVGTVGAGLLTIGGGFALAGAIGQEKNIRAATAALANQARGTEGGQGKSFQQLQQEAMGVARTEGIRGGQGPEAVIGMMRQFQAITGRFDIATKYADYMAEIGDATDAELGDVGRTAGQIFQAINATGKDAQTSIEATMKIMDAMAGQSKIGSIEMNDLAKEMGKLMSATANFKGDIGDLAADMGAMAQTAIAGGASSAPEAMTALMRFADDLVQRGAASPAYKKAGIDVFEREMIGGKEVRGALKSPLEIIKQVVGGTKGDIAKIQSMFGIRAKKAVDPFARIYREAEAKEAGTGIGAIEKRFEQFRAVSLSAEQRQEAAMNRRSQADRDLERVRIEFNDAIGQQLLPVITKMIPKFTELVPALTKILKGAVKLGEWFVDNPFLGIGGIIAASVAKDVASAGIGAAIRGAALGGGGLAGGTKGLVAGLAPAAAVLGVGAAIDQARELVREEEAAQEEAKLKRELALTGADVGERRVRERSFKERLREGVYKPSDLWNEEVVYRDAEGNVQVVDKRKEDWGGFGERGQVRIADPRVQAGPKGGVEESIALRNYFDERRAQWEAEELGVGLTAKDITGTGERVSPETQAAAQGQQDAAKMNLQAAKLNMQAADKLSQVQLNRSDAPSPTAAR